MNHEQLTSCVETVVEAIEENQAACKALNLATDKAKEILELANLSIIEKHQEYDRLVTAKEALFAVLGYPSE